MKRLFIFLFLFISTLLFAENPTSVYYRVRAVNDTVGVSKKEGRLYYYKTDSRFYIANGSNLDEISVSGFSFSSGDLTVDSTITISSTENTFITTDSMSINTDFFVIDKSGNVGIGTAAPSALLTLLGGNFVLREDDDEFNAIQFNSGNVGGIFRVFNAGNTIWEANGNGNSYYLTTFGNFGIGTATPGTELEVDGEISHTTQQTTTLGVGVTTFATTVNIATLTGDGGGNTVATITGSGVGIYTFIFVDALITITDTDAHTANTVDLAGTATDLTSADDLVLQLVYDGTSWYEVSRSAN